MNVDSAFEMYSKSYQTMSMQCFYNMYLRNYLQILKTSSYIHNINTLNKSTTEFKFNRSKSIKFVLLLNNI
jgi:hypothetical protein